MYDPGNFFVKASKTKLAFSLSCLFIVRLISLVFKEEILSDWTIVSISKLFSANAKHIDAATPGRSGSFRKLTWTWFLSNAIPLTSGWSCFSLIGLINIVNNKTEAILSSSDNQCLLEELPDLIEKLEIKMKDAAKELNFEEAANLRDRIKKLRQKLARNN